MSIGHFFRDGGAMLRWFRTKRRERRALNYLRMHPEDEPLVMALLTSCNIKPNLTAREAAQALLGKPFSDVQWSYYQSRWRWERIWVAIAV
jgi:hypothetical protein